MRERPMPDVVHQDGGLDGFGLRIKDKVALLLEVQDGLTHQMESAQRMLETRMASTRVNH